MEKRQISSISVSGKTRQLHVKELKEGSKRKSEMKEMLPLIPQKYRGTTFGEIQREFVTKYKVVQKKLL